MAPSRLTATWAIEQQAREIDVQFLLGHSTPAMLRRYTATYDAEKAARAHALFSPADRLNGRLQDGGNGSRKVCGLSNRPPRRRRQSLIWSHRRLTEGPPRLLNPRP